MNNQNTVPKLSAHTNNKNVNQPKLNADIVNNPLSRPSTTRYLIKFWN